MSWLSFMSKFVTENFKQEVGEKIKRLGDDFKIEERKKNKNYLYLIYTAKK